MKIDVCKLLSRSIFFMINIYIFCAFFKIYYPEIFGRIIILLLVSLIFFRNIDCNSHRLIFGGNKVIVTYGLIILLLIFFQYYFFASIHDYTTKYYFTYIICGLFLIVTFKEDDLYFELKCLRIITLILSISILASVVYPQLFTSTFSFLYSQNRLIEMRNEILRGMFSGFGGEKAYSAHLVVIGLAIELAQIVNKKTRNFKKGSILIVIIHMFALMLTSKRTLFVCAILLLALSLTFLDYKNKYLKILPLVICTVVVLVLIYKLVPQAQITINRIFENENSDSMNGRTIYWDVSKKMFMEKPIYGYGLGSYRAYFETQHWKLSFDGHNSYLQILGETGIIGAIIFFSLYLYSLIINIFCFIKKKSQGSMLCMFIILITLIYAITGNALHTFSQTFALYYCIALTKAGLFLKDFEDKI